MAAFDPNEMIARFKERAASVKRRPLPPVAGEERLEEAQRRRPVVLRVLDMPQITTT
jgi:hypothetical protein